MPHLEIRNLSVTYPNGQAALDDVTLTLSAGSICGLVGINGAGKSTLFKSIMGFVKPEAGSVHIDGKETRRALKAGRIAYVPQSEEVDWNFPVRVKDVVRMGRYGHCGPLRLLRPQDHEAVEAALARVGLSELRNRPISELSGGQRKRVFVARALAQAADIILLDEPFAGIDMTTEESLITLFRAMAGEGRLILVSTHNLGSVPSFCDEVILIRGRIIAHGKVEQVFTRDNLHAAFGGMLRHLQLAGQRLHDDADARGVTVLTDDERPLVLYGEKGGERIVTADAAEANAKK